MAMTASHRTATFVPVPCRCGRLLRAKSELIGSEIQCWDCHQMVVVPCPRQPGQSGRAFSEGLRSAFRPDSLARILLASAAIALAMTIPRIGLLAGGVALAVAGVALVGRTLERSSRGEVPPEPVGGRAAAVALAAQAATAAAMAAGTVVSLWGMGVLLHRGQRWDWANYAVFAATWTIGPIASLMAFGRARRGWLGVRNGLMVAIRHPMMTFLSLAIVPMALVASEFLVAIGTMLGGAFAFFTLDLLPCLAGSQIINGLPHYNGVDFRSLTIDSYLRLYWESLGRGYTFSGALPASLSLPTTNGLSSQGLYVQSSTYLAIRALLTFLVVSVMMTAATLQAAWLGALDAVDYRRVV
ncbi:hypothetical protein TA3x_003891 [Tundrisphaera sp. TA3]|uniref:hypothetical protein n=1 Tax=Tundrisphaera sp. TA3 TaxID=3435775 RepID=UPI003EBF8EBF